MYNDDTDVLFPPRLIPLLRDLRGETWRELVDRITLVDPVHVDRLAFVLLMIRLGSCTTCSADSYRAMRGCTQCALQTVRRHRGSDLELVHEFQEAHEEIERYLHKNSR